jgi:O-antigen/teichoic acid export membrane protein
MSTAADQTAATASPPNGDGATGGRSIAAEMASRISRDSMLYTAVTTTAFPLALANTAVLTRFMSTSEFGNLAILLFWSSMLTIALNLLVLRGIERHVWGASDDMMDSEDGEVAHASVRPRSLGTGLVLNAGIAALAAITVALDAKPLCRLLLLPPGLEPAVVWAGVSGALGSVWRLSTGILRWERRRPAFSTVYIMRWVFALAISWPLLIAGYGPTGAMAGVALGTLVSVVTAMILARKSYRLGFDRGIVKEIMHKNAPMMAMIVGLTILHDADVFLLSRVAPASEVGLYRLATRMTSLVSYAVSAFLIAWSPLEASSLFRATYAELGRARVRATFVTYYIIVGSALVIFMSITAIPVVTIVAPDYGKAAAYVPITSVAYLAYGFLVVVARASEFPRRYVIYGSATLGGAAVMIVICLLLGGPLGGYGVALGDLIGALFGAAVVIIACLLAHKRPAIDAPRVIGTLVVGAICYGVGVPIAQGAGSLEAPLAVLALVMYPVLLLLTGIIPAGDRRQIWQIFRDLRGGPRRARAMLVHFGELTATQQKVMLAVLRDRQPARRAVNLVTGGQRALATELVRGLRTLARIDGTGALDDEIGWWLLSTDAVTSKDAIQRRIEDAGAPPAEIHAVEAAFTDLRSAPAKFWPRAVVTPKITLPDPPWPLDPRVVHVIDRALRADVPRELIAAADGLSERELDRLLVSGLRELAVLPRRASFDRLIAGFLLDREHVPARQLWAAGVDPVEVHELELVVQAIRAIPESRWQEIVAIADGRTAAARDVFTAGNGGRQPAPNAIGLLARDRLAPVVPSGLVLFGANGGADEGFVEAVDEAAVAT